MPEIETDQTKVVSEVKIFTVPFDLDEIEENININNKIANKPPQEQTSLERRQVKQKKNRIKKAQQTTYCSHPFTQVGGLWNSDMTL